MSAQMTDSIGAKHFTKGAAALAMVGFSGERMGDRLNEPSNYPADDVPR
jgi:hypothetical protein